MVYIISFLCSILFLRLADLFKKKGMPIFIFFTITGLLFPIITYSARDNVVGFDVLLYVEPIFKFSIHSNNFYKIFNFYKEDIDILYIAINFLVSRFTQDIFWLHFVIQSILISAYYSCAYSLRKKLPIWSFMLLYYLIFYCQSVNIVRQSLGVAFIMVSYMHYLKGEKKQSLIFFIIAIAFHRISIIGGAYYGIMFVLNLKSTFLRNVIFLIGYLLLVIILIKSKEFLTTLISGGSSSMDRYNAYFDRDTGGKIPLLDIFCRLCTLGVLFYCYKQKIIQSKLILFLIHMTLLSIILFLLNSVLPQSGRLALYFQTTFLISLPLVFFSTKLKQTYRLIGGFFIILIFSANFYSVYLKHGDASGQIMPYKSKILDINDHFMFHK